MKKQLLLATFLIVLSLFASAQNLVKENVVGKWKVTQMISKELKIDVTDVELMKLMMYANDLEKEPGKVFTAEDSAAVNFAAELLNAMFSRMQFTFNANGKYALEIDATMFGVKKKEKDQGEYEVKKNKLLLKEDKAKKIDSIDASMPDNNTLVFSNFGSAMGMSIVLTRQ